MGSKINKAPEFKDKNIRDAFRNLKFALILRAFSGRARSKDRRANKSKTADFTGKIVCRSVKTSE